MYQNTLAALITFVCMLAVAYNGCNHPETIALTGSDYLLPKDSSLLFQVNRRYFILVPGDTAFFSGTRRCSVFVNGVINETLTEFDSVYFRTITLAKDTMMFNGAPYTVYPQLYQMSNKVAALNTGDILRYFLKNDTAVLQIAYIENGVMNYLPAGKQKVFPRYLEFGKFGYLQNDSTPISSNHRWAASPLIKLPITAVNGPLVLEGYSIAPEAIAYPLKLGGDYGKPYTVNGITYRDGVFIITNFIINGSSNEQDAIVRISGTIKITGTYFTNRGMVDQLINSSIQKTYENGAIETKRETIYFVRPEPAKTYPDTLNP
jgi:hypothetical protein